MGKCPSETIGLGISQDMYKLWDHGYLDIATSEIFLCTLVLQTWNQRNHKYMVASSMWLEADNYGKPFVGVFWRAGLVQAVESYRLWPEGPGFESRSSRIAQARVRLATDTIPQTPHRAGALCTGYALNLWCYSICVQCGNHPLPMHWVPMVFQG